MTAVLSPLAKQQFFDSNGRPLVGGKLFTYIAGTTTKQATYVNSGGITPNSNPVILDYRGEANLWVPPNVGYKYVLAPSTDTDPPTNPIWTVDQLVSSQLITLYGGVDTGTPNAYVLTFTANFTSYTDGIVIYWIPSNANTGASTINVNGLGVVSITNQDGSNLGLGELTANQVATILYKGGAFRLISSGTVFFTGNFAPTETGISSVNAVPAGTFWINGKTCTLRLSGNGTSNSTSMTFTGLPASCQPQTAGAFVPIMLIDNGVNIGGWAAIGAGSGTITFGTGFNNNTTGFTAAGLKGVAASATITYPLG